MRYYRPTWAEINLKNLSYNFGQVKRKLSKATKVMATVKADAYGHGLITVSRKLVSCGVDYLGVASIDEGIILRRAGIKAPILVLGTVLKEDITPFFTYNLMPTVCAQDLAVALNNKSHAQGKVKRIHIKVDTGMGRQGVLCSEALALIKKISRLKSIEIEGIFTHFAAADTNKRFTLHQIKIFNRLIEMCRHSGINIPLAHAANSMGIIDFKAGHFNMVRPGLIIYGLNPKKNARIKLRPVLSLKARIIFIKRVPKGFGISYGHSYITKKNTRIAILPIGYGDGYPRNLSDKAPVLIRGKRFKINGRVCMDQIMVDLGDSAAKLGDEVVLIGSQGGNIITAEELAVLSGTIPYEIVCGLGSRIPRAYID